MPVTESLVPDLTAQPLGDVALPAGIGCAACGAPVDPRDKFCTACGMSRPEAASPALATGTIGGAALPEITPEEQVIAAAGDLKTFQCQNCGAQINVDPTQRSYVCPFCDSTYVLELHDQGNKQRPEFVLGFSVTPPQAWEKFQEWLNRGSLFYPLDLQKIDLPDKLRGVYLPFWSFSMLATARWSATIGEYWYRTETYTVTVNGKTETRTRQVQETEWWPHSGMFHHYYYGYLISGSKGLEQKYADAIQPYHLAGVKRYEPYFLAGWLSEEYSIERDAALELCRRVFTQRVTADVTAFLPGDTHRGLEADVNFDNISSDLLLLPVYVLTYKYKNRIYHFVLNGQTGKLHGERPLSWLRIAMYAGGAIVLGLLIALVFRLVT